MMIHILGLALALLAPWLDYQYSDCSSSTWHWRRVVIQLRVRSGSHHQAHGGCRVLLLMTHGSNCSKHLVRTNHSHCTVCYLVSAAQHNTVALPWLWMLDLTHDRTSSVNIKAQANFQNITWTLSAMCCRSPTAPVHPSSKFKMLSPSVSRLTSLQLHIFSQQFLQLFTIIFSQ